MQMQPAQMNLGNAMNGGGGMYGGNGMGGGGGMYSGGGGGGGGGGTGFPQAQAPGSGFPPGGASGGSFQSFAQSQPFPGAGGGGGFASGMNQLGALARPDSVIVLVASLVPVPVRSYRVRILPVTVVRCSVPPSHILCLASS